MENEIVNRVAKSPIVTINPEDFIPDGERVFIDLKDVLFQGMILKEAEFRHWTMEHDWAQYKDKFVAIDCTADAIIPQWAYMVITGKLSKYARYVCRGGLAQLEKELFINSLHNSFNPENLIDKPVVIKGCFDKPVPEDAYTRLTAMILPYAKSIMYGEPCSTVPVYKAPKKIDS